jgi:hypothetical protein
MPIQATAPIVAAVPRVVTQTETKTFNAFWITRVFITSLPGPKGGTSLRATLIPWNTETHEVLESDARELKLDELQQMIAGGDTQLGGVFAAVIAEIERQARARDVI